MFNDGRHTCELPIGWEETTIGDIVNNVQYGFTAKSSKMHHGPKYLRITDIQNGKVNWDLVPNCNISSNHKSKYLLRPGDILFTRTGATTGKSYLVTKCPESIFASYLTS